MGAKFAGMGLGAVAGSRKLANSVKSAKSTGSSFSGATNKVKYIGKVDDLKGIPRNQTLLDDLPNLGNPKANWKQNSSVLRKEMNKGNPISDASAHLPDNNPKVKGSFLGAERNLLRSKGWSFDKSTGLWSPPN
jgi:hypothetical protein